MGEIHTTAKIECKYRMVKCNKKNSVSKTVNNNVEDSKWTKTNLTWASRFMKSFWTQVSSQ